MSLVIDCDTCTRQDTPTCSDCVVSFFINRPEENAVVIDMASFAAIRRLQRAGMVPTLQHSAQPGARPMKSAQPGG